MAQLQSAVLHPDRFPVRDRYPFNLAVFQHSQRIDLQRPVTLFVGENGTGKSTLLEAICRRCGIHIWGGPHRTRLEPNPFEAALCRAIEVEHDGGAICGAFFASQIFRHFAQNVDEWAAADPGILEYFGGRSLLTQSHGQSLMSFFRSRCRVKGVYFLDEPETALSPKSLLGLLRVLAEATAAGVAQFIIATHSPILLACPEATILSFDRRPISPIRYEETEHYRIYREFMLSPDRYLAGLGDPDVRP